MTNKFNNKVAKEIASISFGYVVDSMLGISDPDYTLGTEKDEFQDNFAEDLEFKNLIVTERRVEIIGEFYEAMRYKMYVQMIKKYRPDLAKTLSK